MEPGATKPSMVSTTGMLILPMAVPAGTSMRHWSMYCSCAATWLLPAMAELPVAWPDRPPVPVTASACTAPPALPPAQAVAALSAKLSCAVVPGTLCVSLHCPDPDKAVTIPPRFAVADAGPAMQPIHRKLLARRRNMLMSTPCKGEGSAALSDSTPAGGEVKRKEVALAPMQRCTDI